MLFPLFDGEAIEADEHLLLHRSPCPVVVARSQVDRVPGPESRTTPVQKVVSR